MFNALLKLLGKAGHDIQQGAGNVVHNVEQGASNVAHNVAANVTHPQNIPQNILHTLAALVPHVTAQPLSPGDGWGSPTGYNMPGQVPNLNNPQQDPTSVGRVWGTAAANNVADLQGYSPAFRKIVMGASPYVGATSNPKAGGEYIGSPVNEIQLRPQQLDPYTITHEGLHAAFDRKSPQAQAAFAQIAKQATPIQQRMLASTEQLGNPIYRGQTPLTEVHSFLPQLGQASPTQQYYQRYFSNPNFYQEPNTKYRVADAAGFNTQNPGYALPKLPFGPWEN